MTAVRHAPVAGAATRPSRPALVVLRDRNFWPFFAGNLLSNSGTWFQNIAATLLVYRMTGSVLLVGVVNFAQFAGVLVFGPLAGVVADRHDRRRILLVTQGLQALLTLALAAATIAEAVSVPLVIGVVLVLGVVNAFAIPPMLALVPQLVPPERLGAAVALNVATFNGARAVGPVLGAFVVDRFGAGVAFGVNGLSFLALLGALMVVRPLSATPHATRRERARMLPSLRRLAGDPRLAVLLLCGAATSMAIDPVVTLSPALAVDVLGRSDSLVGWLVAAFGAGSLVGALTVAGRSAASDRVLLPLLAAVPVALLVFASSGVLWVTLGALGVAGFAFIGSMTGVLTRLQLAVPAAEHGRLMAVWSLAFMGSRPLGSLVDGVLASRFSVVVAVVVVVLPSAVMTLRARKVLRAPMPTAREAAPRSPSRTNH